MSYDNITDYCTVSWIHLISFNNYGEAHSDDIPNFDLSNVPGYSLIQPTAD